jgi:hypothetical protein
MTLDEFGYNPQSLAVLSNVMYQLPYIMAGVISSDLNAAYMAVVNRRLSTVNRLMTQLELFGGVLNNPGMVGNVPARIASMQMAIGDGIGRGQLKIDEEIREYIRRATVRRNHREHGTRRHRPRDTPCADAGGGAIADALYRTR